MTRQETHVVQICVIRNSASIAQALGAKAQQIEQARRKADPLSISRTR